MLSPVALDAMGADGGPEPLVEGARRAAAQGIPVVLVGDREHIVPLLDGADIDVVHAPDVIPMAASPVEALRRWPEASVSRAVGLVEDGRACAVVSCGNSGATVVEAIRRLGVLDGVERPALGVALQLPGGSTLHVLDVGATVDARVEHLVGYVALGRAWARSRGVEAPRVGLLSNGEERTKGTRLVHETLDRLESEGSDVRPVEPGPALGGAVDVLVTDGFTGNILLKTMEAAAAAARLLAGGRAETSQYGGALLVGLDGVAIIGHGSSGPDAVAAALREAASAAAGQGARAMASDLSGTR